MCNELRGMCRLRAKSPVVGTMVIREGRVNKLSMGGTEMIVVGIRLKIAGGSVITTSGTTAVTSRVSRKFMVGSYVIGTKVERPTSAYSNSS